MALAASRNRRIDLSAPLSISLRGWGRWNTPRTPRRDIRTREPRPSVSSAPSAASRCSTSAHATSDRTGSSKIAERVRRCLPESATVPLYDTMFRPAISVAPARRAPIKTGCFRATLRRCSTARGDWTRPGRSRPSPPNCARPISTAAFASTPSRWGWSSNDWTPMSDPAFQAGRRGILSRPLLLRRPLSFFQLPRGSRRVSIARSGYGAMS